MKRTCVATVALALFSATLARAEDVAWTSTTNVTATGNDLEKTSGAVAWNAGAISTVQFTWGPVYVEFTATETNKLRACGLSKGNTDATLNDIDFAIQVNASGTYQAYEAGAAKGSSGSYSSGDKFRVEAEPGIVRYLKNGTAFYTSTLPPKYPLLVDAAFNTLNGTINDAVVGTSVFSKATSVTVAAGSLAKTGSSGWNAGASSATRIETGDGYVEFTATETNTSRALGLSRGDVAATLADIDFAIHLKDDGTFEAVEGGTSQGNLGSYSASDVFRVEVSSGSVLYKKNGTTQYTSGGTPTYPLVADAALDTVGATLTDVKVVPVVWTGVTSVSASGTTLTKTGSGGFNGGASSTTSFTGDGYMEFTAIETNMDRIAGLSNGDGSQSDSDVDFGIWLKSDGTARVLEAGTDRGGFGSYALGDRFRVEVAEGVVVYRKNGAVIYTSTVGATFPLLVDTSLDEVGSTVAHVTIGRVVWKSDSGLAVHGASLQKTASAGWNNAGAVSTYVIPSGTGSVEFTASETGISTTYARVIGLSNGNTDNDDGDVNFAIYLQVNGLYTVYENGSSKTTATAFSNRDVFKVEVVSGTVKYYRNGTLLYTSLTTATYPLLVDTAMDDIDATLTDVVLSGFTVPIVPTPTFSPTPGTFGSAQNVQVLAMPGASIRYTTDGNTPTESSTLYSSAINVATTTTLKAKAWRTPYDPSAVATGTYQMNFGTAAAPAFDPVGGTYASSATVSMSTTTTGGTIRYTTDGSTPTGSSTVYSSPVVVSATTTLKARTYHIDYTESSVTTATYTIQVAQPTFTPDGGSHAAGTTITVATATSGATIRYTLTGVDPTTSDPVIASGGTLVVGNYTLKAKAYKSGCTDSTTKSADYTMTGVFTPGALTGGTSYVLALKHDGTVWSWGNNGSGRLGDGTTNTAMRPVRVASLTGVTAIAAGSAFGVALRNDGTVWTWGYDQSGELGNGAAGQTNWPAPISLTNVTHIAAGASHALARKSDGTVVAWGYNGSGQLGDGTTTNRTSPVAVTDLTGVASVTAGDEHSVAVLSNGTVKAWGANFFKQLGDGTTTNRWTATTVDGLFSIATAAAGPNHTLALTDDGRVWAWGVNSSGTLGDGTDYQGRTTPVQALISGVTAVAATSGASFAVKADETLWSWGSQGFGALGDGQTNSVVKVPTQVAGVSGIAAVGAGLSSVGLARTTDRKALAWGNNGTVSVLGDGTVVTRTVPTEVSAADFDWKVGTPTFTVTPAPPYGGLQTVNVTSTQSVAIATQTSGASIYYTTNGVDPTTSDTLVTGNVSISDSTTLKARAYKSGVPTSNVDGVIFAYKVATPTFSPTPLTNHPSAQTVTISCATSSSSIRYTTDGSEPTGTSTLYTGTIAVSTETTIKAKGFKSGWTESNTATATYGFDYNAGSTPSISPSAGSYVESVSVTISGGPSGATLRYTTNGVDPTVSSAIYTSPIAVTAATTVKARAFHIDYDQSAVASAVYTIQLPAPTISPSAGSYSYGQQVTISTAYSGATIRYTLGGADPTANDPAIPSGTSLTLLATATVKAKLFKSGFTDSTVTSNAYTITGSGTSYGSIEAARSSFAVRSGDSTFWGWGWNNNKQLGDGTTTTAYSPRQITGFGTVTAAANGLEHTVALRSDGLVYAAGLNTSGQLGDGTTSTRTNPVQVINLSSVTAVGAGASHGLAVMGGGAWAWGENGDGQLGDDSTTDRSTAVQPQGLTSNVTAVTGGASHSLALKSDGTVWAWGDNQYGQLGDTTTTDRDTPVQVSGISTATAIAAGDEFSLALLSDGTVKAWGQGTFSQLGNGGTTNQSTPVTVTGLAGVRAIGAGYRQAMAARADGGVVTWGYSTYSMLGVPGVLSSAYPIFVPGLAGIVQVAVGENHSLAMASDGTVWGWGYNNYGPAGDGTYLPRTSPVKVSDAAMAWKACTPMLDVMGTTYQAEKTVTLDCTTSGALVHYTTSGVDPTDTDPSVSPGGTVNVTSSGTLKARAFKSGLGSSNVASETYTLQVPAVGYSPEPGNFSSDQTVTLSSTVSGVTIRYTTDGSVPTESSTTYSSPLSVGATQTLHAKGWRTGWNVSTDSFGTYNMKVAAPAPSPTPGSYTSPQTVTLTTTTTGAVTINYTLDGSEPNDSSPSVAPGGTVVVGKSAALAMMARRAGWTNSDITWAYYSISLGTVATPTISPAAGTYTAVQNVTLSTTTVGATIRYTTDGTDPTLWSTIYTGPITVDASMTVKAKAFKEEHAASSVASSAYTINLTNTVAPATFSPPAGSYPTTRTVTLTTATSGALIHYTTNGLDPMETDSSVSSGGTVSIDRHRTLKAKAFKATMTPSPVRRADYQITGVSAGTGMHGVAIKTDGTVWCFRENMVGQLGNNSTTDSVTPVQASGVTNAVSAAGASHSIIAKSDGTVWAWGLNANGQLGDNSTTNRWTPVQTSGLSTAVAVAAGPTHSLALQSDGTVKAWGNNSNGKLGDGTLTQRLTPVSVSSLTDVVAVAAGESHSVALKKDGTVWAWGLNSSGQLGDGTTTQRSTPVQMVGISGITAIAAGGDHTRLLKTDGAAVGSMWAWGGGNFGVGLLGTGGTNNVMTPVKVLANAVAVASSDQMGLGLTTEGAFRGLMGAGAHFGNTIPDSTGALSGLPAVSSSFVPLATDRYVSASAGEALGVALKWDTSLFTWGATPSAGNGFVLGNGGSAGDDPDGDGLTTGQEWAVGTDPWTADTNGDGISDGEALSTGRSATDLDMDADGVLNATERANGTDPFRSDTDNDTVGDATDCFPLDPTRSACPPTLTQNLVSFWTLNEASGTRNDSAGTNHLTDNNTVAQAAGAMGSSGQFVAANSEWLSVADNSSLGFTTAMSVSMWIRQDTLGLDRAFAGKWAYQTDGGWAIQSGNASGNSADISVYIATSATDDGTGCRMDFNDANMTAGQWHHIVMVYDGAATGNASRLKAWVDGVAKTLTVGAGAVPATLRNDTAALNLGKFGGSLTRYLDGRMDEVALWSRALAASEVTQLNNAAGGVTSYWALDEASGTRNDSVGTNNLTDNNTVTQGTGKLGSAAQFTAANSEWLNVADNSSLGFTTAMSASMWIRQDSLALDRAFLGKWAYQTDGGWAIQSGNASGNSADISVYIATSAADDGTGCRMDFNDADMSASTWHHVLVAYDGTLTGNANRLKVWVDGVQKTLTVGAGSVPSTLRADGADLNFGKFGGTWTRYLDGRMDEVRIWPRALTAAEASQIYNAGNGLNYPPADTIPPAITLTEPTNAVLQ